MRPKEEHDEVIRLYKEGGMTYRQIGETVGVPLETVKCWIRLHNVGGGKLRPSAGKPGQPLKKPRGKTIPEKDYEKRIKQLEMEVELLRDFLLETERGSIKKQSTK